MKKELKNKLNALGRLFYKSQGYEVDGNYDFSEARHPQEIGIWNQTLIAYAFLNNKYDILKYQK